MKEGFRRLFCWIPDSRVAELEAIALDSAMGGTLRAAFSAFGAGAGGRLKVATQAATWCARVALLVAPLD